MTKQLFCIYHQIDQTLLVDPDFSTIVEWAPEQFSNYDSFANAISEATDGDVEVIQLHEIVSRGDDISRFFVAYTQFSSGVNYAVIEIKPTQV